MEPLVFDRYETPVRIFLTGVLAIAALVMAVLGILVLAAIFLLGSAIAFHSEYRLIIDLTDRTYEKRILVRPFGQAVTGPLDDLEAICIQTVATQYETKYQAFIISRPAYVGGSWTFILETGSISDVTHAVTRLAKATGLPVRTSKELSDLHQTLDSLGLAKLPRRPGGDRP